MDALSESYAKTLVHLESDAATNAYTEFRTGARMTVKKLYSEAASVYPLRFARIGEWCVWTRELFKLSARIETSLAAVPAKGSAGWNESGDMLESLRKHFWTLHAKTETLAANDYIYAFRQAANKAEPDVAALKEAMKALGGAPASRTAKARPADYQKAKADWEKAVAQMLADDALGADEVKPLREAAETFYCGFGIQFE